MLKTRLKKTWIKENSDFQKSFSNWGCLHHFKKCSIPFKSSKNLRPKVINYRNGYCISPSQSLAQRTNNQRNKNIKLCFPCFFFLHILFLFEFVNFCCWFSFVFHMIAWIGWLFGWVRRLHNVSICVYVQFGSDQIQMHAAFMRYIQWESVDSVSSFALNTLLISAIAAVAVVAVVVLMTRYSRRGRIIQAVLKIFCILFISLSFFFLSLSKKLSLYMWVDGR